MQIKFAAGVEGPVKVSNSAQYERVFEGEGPFDVEPEEWAHLQTARTNVLEVEELSSLASGGQPRTVRVTKTVPLFEVVGPSKKAAKSADRNGG